jgi:hypothetical protein
MARAEDTRSTVEATSDTVAGSGPRALSFALLLMDGCESFFMVRPPSDLHREAILAATCVAFASMRKHLRRGFASDLRRR